MAPGASARILRAEEETESLKINQIYLKIVTLGFLDSLITDLHLDLKNSKW